MSDEKKYLKQLSHYKIPDCPHRKVGSGGSIHAVNSVQDELETLRKQAPRKCQRCECLESDFKDGGWFLHCSETVCYMDGGKPCLELRLT